jgi:hypothetical protein
MFLIVYLLPPLIEPPELLPAGEELGLELNVGELLLEGVVFTLFCLYTGCSDVLTRGVELL